MSASDPDGHLSVEREGDAVQIVIDGLEEPVELNPVTATRLAMMLNQAAADARRYQQQRRQP